MTAPKKTAAPAATPEFDPNADPTQAPQDWNWETVRDEAPIGVVFDTIGDEFVGQFQRKQHVDREMTANGEDQSFDLFIFKGRDGKPYALPNSYVLEQAYEDEIFKAGDWVRIVYVKDVKTSGGKNDMKDLMIQVRR